MRLFVASIALWASLASAASADVILPGQEGMPRRRRWPGYEPPAVEQPTNPPAPPPIVEPVADDPPEVPEEAGLALGLALGLVLLLGVREARSERSTA